jgi:CHAT domain-containing protein
MALIQEKRDAGKIELQGLPYADPYHWAAFTITGGKSHEC